MTHITYPNDDLTAKGRNGLVKQQGICVSNRNRNQSSPDIKPGNFLFVYHGYSV